MGETRSKRDYVVIEGSASHRGLIYGETLRGEINELVVLWKEGLQRNTGMPADDFIPRFLDRTSYMPAIERYTPDLLEEVKGLARGANISFDTMFAFQLLDELILNAGEVAAHCSAIGVDRTRTKPTLLGQNWDIESYVHGYQTVLHVKEKASDVESLVFTYAGLIAAFGLNNKGVGVCLNSMPILRYAQSGLPVAYVIRGTLQQRDSIGAIDFVRSVPHASPQNYLIGDPERVVDLECSAGQVEQHTAAKTPSVVFHTNHPLANDDFNDKYRAVLRDREANTRTDDFYHQAVDFVEANSGTRLASLRTHLAGLTADDITVDKIRAILSSHDRDDHPVCMSLGDATKLASIVSTVMELSDNPRFHVAFGPPDITPYRTYTFSSNPVTTLDY
jgi:isopenicillin-N N-acyltransferase like protein